MEWIKKNIWHLTPILMLVGWFIFSQIKNDSVQEKLEPVVEVVQEPETIDLAYIIEKQEEKIRELEAANIQLEKAIVAAVTKQTQTSIKKKPTLTDTIIWQLQKKYSR